jgi:hypothetical protein
MNTREYTYFNPKKLPKFKLAKNGTYPGCIFYKQKDTAVVTLNGDFVCSVYEGIMRASGYRGRRKRFDAETSSYTKDAYIKSLEEEIIVSLGTIIFLQLTLKRDPVRMGFMRSRLEKHVYSLIDQGVEHLEPNWSVLHSGCSVMLNPKKLVEMNRAFKLIKKWYINKVEKMKNY